MEQRCFGEIEMEKEDRSDRQALLYMGEVNYLNGVCMEQENRYLLVVSLPPIEVEAPANTILLDLTEQGVLEYRLVDIEGHVYLYGNVHRDQLFVNMMLGDEVRRAVLAKMGEQVAEELATFVPLFYLSWDEIEVGGKVLQKNLHVYSQIRFALTDALFIRTSPTPYVQVISKNVSDIQSLPLGDALSNFREAVRLHAVDPVFLNNHQCYYKKCYPGKELENKFNLAPTTNIWGTTVEIYNRLRAGQMPGYIMEYKDEFQQWDYLNFLYEIPAPEEEQGYISFIPTTDGKYTIKRKWYGYDQLIRGEKHRKGVTVTVPFDEFIRDEYGLEPHRLPGFRRVRYDVNFESVRSGHVYGIFFDHCLIIGAEQIVLSQCEIEYLRSRVRLEPDESIILDELEAITAWVRAFLDEKGIAYTQGFYSKLSFLRDHEEEVQQDLVQNQV